MSYTSKDEFVVILHTAGSAAEVEKIGLRIQEKVGEPMHLGGNDCKVGASIGAAIYPIHGTTEDLMLNAANSAMYQAKRTGKNRVVMAEITAG